MKELLRRVFGTPSPESSLAQQPLTGEDVRFAGLLLLGVDTPPTTDFTQQGNLAHHIQALIRSNEYQTAILHPLLGGGFVDDARYRGPPKPEFRHWLSDRLPLTPTVGLEVAHGGTGWRKLVAAVMGDASFQQAFVPRERRGLNEELVGTLRDRVPPLNRLVWMSLGSQPQPADQLLNRVVNLSVESLENIQVEAGGVLRFLSEDPAIEFQLSDSAKEGLFCEVRFCTRNGRKQARSKLYVDLGNGYSETNRLDLYPRGRWEYSAILCDPGSVRRLRWDPDDRPGTIELVGLAAHPLSAAELLVKAGDRSSELSATVVEILAEASNRRGGPDSILSASRQLTREVADHRDEPVIDYSAWIENNELPPSELRTWWQARLEQLGHKPLISIILPVYNTPESLLKETLDSAISQIYENWELCIADDASEAPHVRQLLERYASADSRITVTYRKVNGHISEASNTALDLVRGEWLVLLDHDDLLAPHALAAVADVVERSPDLQVIYSDEDKVDLQGSRSDPYFKPEFSPDLLRSQNYINHLTPIRTSAVRDVGGWRTGVEGSQDHDPLLRVTERLNANSIRRIPEILYHWRITPGSTASAVTEKSYALEAGLRAVSDHLARVGASGYVEHAEPYPWYRVRYDVQRPEPLVSVITPTRDQAKVLDTCVTSILASTDYPNYEVIIVDNGSVEAETEDLFNRLRSDERVRVLAAPGPFNFSRINNFAAGHARGEVLALVNNDVEIISPLWLRDLTAWAMRPEVGAVGAKLLYPDGSVQHGGVIVGIGGVAGHAHKYAGRTDPGYFGRLVLPHNVSAVTGACLFIRASVYSEVGGLDEELAVAFNDVDFCLRVRMAGYWNVMLPSVELFHHESKSRGAEDRPEKVARFNKEVEFMKRRWGERLSQDPFYSPNLTLEREDFSLRDVPEEATL